MSVIASAGDSAGVIAPQRGATEQFLFPNRWRKPSEVLSSKYTLSPQYEHFRSSGQWKALPTKESLIDLGQRIIDSVPAEERKHFAAPLIEGFNNLCLNLDSISEALRSHYFAKKFVTAVG